MTEFQIDSVEVDVGTAIVFAVWKILGKGKTIRLMMTENHISNARRGYSNFIAFKSVKVMFALGQFEVRLTGRVKRLEITGSHPP
jgi:hypothetical protein